MLAFVLQSVDKQSIISSAQNVIFWAGSECGRRCASFGTHVDSPLPFAGDFVATQKNHIVARQKCGADEPPNHLHPLILFFRDEGCKKGTPQKEIEFVPFRATLRSKSAQQISRAKSHNSTDCIPLRMDTGKQREKRPFTRENVRVNGIS